MMDPEEFPDDQLSLLDKLIVKIVDSYMLVNVKLVRHELIRKRWMLSETIVRAHLNDLEERLYINKFPIRSRPQVYCSFDFDFRYDDIQETIDRLNNPEGFERQILVQKIFELIRSYKSGITRPEILKEIEGTEEKSDKDLRDVISMIVVQFIANNMVRYEGLFSSKNMKLFVTGEWSVTR